VTVPVFSHSRLQTTTHQHHGRPGLVVRRRPPASVRGPWLLSVLLSVLVSNFVMGSGCASQTSVAAPNHPQPLPNAGTRSSCEPYHHPITLEVRIPELRPMALPDPIRLTDPKRTTRSLWLLRRMASRHQARSRRKDMAQLAALLWRMALEKAHRLPGLTGRRALILQRDIHAHLREAAALLEQTLHEDAGFALARLRLAYYLREVRPADAVFQFRQLLSLPASAQPQDTQQDWSPTATRPIHRLALAQLLLRLGRPVAALHQLKVVATTKRSQDSATAARLKARNAYLRFVAQWQIHHFDRAMYNLIATAKALPSRGNHATHGAITRLSHLVARAWPAAIAMTKYPVWRFNDWRRLSWWKKVRAAKPRGPSAAAKGPFAGSSVAARLLNEAIGELIRIGRKGDATGLTEKAYGHGLGTTKRPETKPARGPAQRRELAAWIGFCLLRYRTDPKSIPPRLDLMIDAERGDCSGIGAFHSPLQHCICHPPFHVPDTCARYRLRVWEPTRHQAAGHEITKGETTKQPVTGQQTVKHQTTRQQTRR